jgi:cytoskeleton protein RodZ
MPSVRKRHGLAPSARAALLAGGTVALLFVLWLVLRPVDTGSGEGGAKPPPAPAAAAPEVAPAADVTAAAPPVPAPTPAEPTASAAQVTAPEPEDEGIREEPPPNIDEPMDELVLRFSGESWVEVADITGRHMAYRMANFPDVLRLRGLAPFDILLGNARHVSIEYNGKPYENVPISRTNVASFRLGHSSDEGVKDDASQKSDPPT